MRSRGEILGAMEAEIKELWRKVQRLELIETPAPGAGSGDVVGPAGATDEAVARYNLATGKLIQDSVMTVTDAGTVNIPVGQTYNIAGVPLDDGGDPSNAPASSQTILAGTCRYIVDWLEVVDTYYTEIADTAIMEIG